MNSAGRLVFSSSRSDHITPLLHQLHWLKALELIQFKLAVLTYRCIHRMALTYLADKLLQPADLGIRTHLRSALTTSLPVRRTRLSTVGDRAFFCRRCPHLERPAAPRHVRIISACFRSRLRMHLFRRFFPLLLFCAYEVTCHYWVSVHSFLFTYTLHFAPCNNFSIWDHRLEDYLNFCYIFWKLGIFYISFCRVLVSGTHWVMVNGCHPLVKSVFLKLL